MREVYDIPGDTADLITLAVLQDHEVSLAMDLSMATTATESEDILQTIQAIQTVIKYFGG